MKSAFENYRKKEKLINLSIGIPLGIGGAITLAYANIDKNLIAALCGMSAYIIGIPYLYQEYHNRKSEKKNKTKSLENQVLH